MAEIDATSHVGANALSLHGPVEDLLNHWDADGHKEGEHDAESAFGQGVHDGLLVLGYRRIGSVDGDAQRGLHNREEEPHAE
mgnify:CR=1 FL=1